MIKYYSKKAKDSTAQELAKYSSGAWVNVEAPTADELNQLSGTFKIDKRLVSEALDVSAIPQITISNGLAYLYIRLPHQVNDEVATMPLLFVVSKESLITISAHHAPIYDRFLNDDIEYTTTERTQLGLLLFSEIGREYEKFINQIGRRIEAIRLKLRGQVISNNDFVDFVVIEGELNELATVMSSTAVMLKSMSGRNHAKSFENYSDLIHEIDQTNERAISNCSLYEKSISSIRDAYSTLSNNRLNQTMKILTVATLFIALPTSLYSMYGMNVPLPMQNEPWAFAFLILLSFGLPVAIMFWARRKKLL
jgi:magnesium transporter